MSHLETHILAFDADGALYNPRYFRLLIEIINRHFEFFESLGTRDNFLDVDVQEIKAKTDAIIEEIYSIELSEEACSNIRSGITNPDFLNKMHAVWLSLMEEDPGVKISKVIVTIMREFINYMNRIDKSILRNLFLAANKELLSHLANKMEIQEVEKFALVVASNRQSIFTDRAGMKLNGTGSIYLDIYEIQNEMNTQLRDKFCVVSQFCLADIVGHLKRGESFYAIVNEHMFNDDESELCFTHSTAIYDEKKLALIYAIAHDSVLHMLDELGIKDKDTKVIIDFYDDRFDILDSLTEILDTFPQLLPANVTLNLFPYGGILNVSPIASIQGTGVLDFNYRRNVRLMAQMCGWNKDNQEVIDTASQLDVYSFLSARVTGLELVPYTMNSFANLFQPKKPETEVESVHSDNLLLRPVI